MESEPKFKVGDEVLWNGLVGKVEQADWIHDHLKWIYDVLFPDGESASFDEFELTEVSREPATNGRVQFEGGGFRDSQGNKPRFDLLIPKDVPFEQQYLTRCARLMAKGASHYEDRNWENFADQEALDRAKSSAFRHFMQWFTGEEDEDHAAAVFFNIMAAENVKEKMK